MPVCVITGASSGIGEALALEMGRRGYAVGLIARRLPALEEVAEKLRSTGVKAQVAAADVTDAAALQAAVLAIEGALGSCDVMVANAGGAVGNGKAFSSDDCLQTMRLNFDSVVHSFAAVLPRMEARGQGQVVVISSIAAIRGLPRSGPYCASKAAVSALCEAMRSEYAPRGITITTVQPGFISTPLTAKNKFSMPFIMPAAEAARRIANAIEGRRRVYTFPLPMYLLISLARLFPPWLWDRAMGPRGKK